jgi:hypothetical protein
LFHLEIISKGETIHLSLKEDIVIEKKLKKLGKSYNQYSYYKHGKDYRVGECIYVVNRLYRANSNTIHIELFDNKDTKNYDTFYESKPFI